MITVANIGLITILRIDILINLKGFIIIKNNRVMFETLLLKIICLFIIIYNFYDF